jgi:adenylosuccinate synthase
MRAYVVVDLGFGDSGKGTIVDYLARTRGAGLVVRWNGGAQAGHAVVTDDGRAHVFSQFGAGSFVPGVRTHLAEPFLLHPTALLVEARHLADKGVPDALDRLTIAERSRVVTPLHQATNRLRELARGAARHGTCGVGIGETVRDALDAPRDAIRARDLVGDRDALYRKLHLARERLASSLPRIDRALPGAADELRVLEDLSWASRWIDATSALRRYIVPDEALARMLRRGPAILEGAQGMLLDERHGFHPHTTWSDCTPRAAMALLEAHGVTDGIERIGVLRTYLTRHGEGPFPTEAPELRLPEAHNGEGGWQGAFRVGHLDLVLLRYALRAAGGVDALALTHADRLGAVRSVVTAYEGPGDTTMFVQDTRARIVDVIVAQEPDDAAQCARQERLGRALRAVRPIVKDAPKDRFVEHVEAELGARVRIVSSGPTASAKRER